MFTVRLVTVVSVSFLLAFASGCGVSASAGGVAVLGATVAPIRAGASDGSRGVPAAAHFKELGPESHAHELGESGPLRPARLRPPFRRF